MINLFNKHPKESKFSGYFSHMKFAVSISLQLLASSVVFIAHAVFPFIKIPKFLNLEGNISFLIDKNNELH
jgi:hypothetical protein